jgi:hypothetical protein
MKSEMKSEMKAEMKAEKGLNAYEGTDELGQCKHESKSTQSTQSTCAVSLYFDKNVILL